MPLSFESKYTCIEEKNVNNFDTTNNGRNAGPILKKIIIWSIVGAILSIIALIGIFGSWYIIDSGEKGVIRRFGETIKVAEPGLGFKIPIVDSVIVIPVREQTITFGSRDKNGELATTLSAYTRDQQSVSLMTSITFTITDPIRVYNTYRTVENMNTQTLGPRIREQVERTFGQYSVIDSINKRGELSQSLADNVREALRSQPIEIRNFSLVELKYSDAYEQGVEKSMQEEINRQTALREKETETIRAETNRIRQQGISDAYLIDQKAKADAVRMQGQAEADAIKAKSDALEKQGTGLIQLTLAEKWQGQLPQTMIPNSALPMLDINKLTEGKSQ